MGEMKRSVEVKNKIMVFVSAYAKLLNRGGEYCSPRKFSLSIFICLYA